MSGIEVTDHSQTIMKMMMTKLYNTITGAGEAGEIKIPRNKSIMWMMPGIPFAPEEFAFCTKGIVGDSAEETKELQHQAWVISKLFDFIPELPEGNMQFTDTTKMLQTMYGTTQDTISSVFGDVLKYSMILNNELSDEEKEKVQKFRNLLTSTEVVENKVTGEKKTVSKPGEVTVAYNQKMNEYISAADELCGALIDAQSAKGPEGIKAVARWGAMGKHLKKKLEAAEMAWVSEGYKNEFEFMNGYINQVSMKSMVLYKQDLLNKYNSGKMNSTNEGTAGEFFYTTLIPGSFATSTGWTQFEFSDAHKETFSSEVTTKWGAQAGAKFGWHFSASADSEKKEVVGTEKLSDFKAHMEIAQIPIVRPWADFGFFFNRAWDLDNLWYLSYDNKPVSDGTERPVGRLVAYPVMAIFVRNVTFSFAESESMSKEIQKKFEAKGSVGWGPIGASGHYSKGSQTKEYKADIQDGKIIIPGIQLVGMLVNVLPKCPNLHPDIKREQLVGGGGS
jgi:hypothetical protein